MLNKSYNIMFYVSSTEIVVMSASLMNDSDLD